MLEYMAPLMFAGLVVFLLIGYPVAFSLCFTGLAFGLLGIQLGMLQPALLQALPERVLGIMSNSTLLAIPFFTFMGLILERSGMAEDLLDTIGQLFGKIRGGVAYAVIFVGALLAATTGVVAASVLAMGLISLPVMMRYGYSNRLSTGVIAASGTLAQIKRKLSWKLLREAVESTATMTSFVMSILVGSTVFSLVFRGVDGDLWV